MRSLSILVMCALMPCRIHAQAPDWVTQLGVSKSYPDYVYITGFGMATLQPGGDKGETLEKAKNNARRNLTEKIQVHLQNMVRTHVEESGKDLADYFSATTQSITNIELSGLEWKDYYDKATNTAYTLAFVKREKLAEEYNLKADEVRRQIIALLDAGKRYEDTGERTKSLQSYLACYPLLNQLVEAQSILATVQSSMTEAFAELDDTVPKDKVSIDQVREAVERLAQLPLKSVDDLGWYMAYMISQRMGSKKGTVLVAPFTYQDTKMGSPFSRYFQQILSNKMTEVAGWEVVGSVDINVMDGPDMLQKLGAPRHTEYVLTGTYWEESGGLRLMSSLQKTADGSVQAGVEVTVPLETIQTSGKDLKPQNFAQAMSDQKVFAQNEVVESGLSLEVWTNRGSENLIYTRGEPMRVYVRVNMPCYIRFIYHLADSTRTLLMDSHYIDESKVNMAYRIPEEFECAPPFGVEVLQVFARTKPFDYVETVYRDGYFILREDLEKYMSKVRGFKRKENADVLQAEKRIILTTLEE